MPSNPYLRKAKKYATRHLPKGTSTLPGAQMDTSSTPPAPSDNSGNPPCWDTDDDGDDTGGPTSGSGQ